MGVQIKGRVKCDVCSRKPISCWVEQTGPTKFVPVDLPSGWKLETRSGYRDMLDREAEQAERDREAAEIARQIESGERVQLGGGLSIGGQILRADIGNQTDWEITGATSIAGYVEPEDRLVTCSEDCRKAYESQLRLSDREPDKAVHHGGVTIPWDATVPPQTQGPYIGVGDPSQVIGVSNPSPQTDDGMQTGWVHTSTTRIPAEGGE